MSRIRDRDVRAAYDKWLASGKCGRASRLLREAAILWGEERAQLNTLDPRLGLHGLGLRGAIREAEIRANQMGAHTERQRWLDKDREWNAKERQRQTEQFVAPA